MIKSAITKCDRINLSRDREIVDNETLQVYYLNTKILSFFKDLTESSILREIFTLVRGTKEKLRLRN